jgi:hypothetical protein
VYINIYEHMSTVVDPDPAKMVLIRVHKTVSSMPYLSWQISSWARWRAVKASFISAIWPPPDPDGHAWPPPPSPGDQAWSPFPFAAPPPGSCWRRSAVWWSSCWVAPSSWRALRRVEEVCSSSCLSQKFIEYHTVLKQDKGRHFIISI